MLNQSDVVTRVGTTRKTILVDELNSTALSCMVANTGVEANEDGRKIVKAGTPLYGSLTARDTAFTTSATGEAAKATASVPTGQTGVTAAAVVVATFGTAVGGIGDRYTFIATVDTTTTWKLEGETVDLATYGITPTGTADNGDKITVIYTPAGPAEPVGIILHDVDVTKGTANSQVVIDGTIDVSKLESDVVTMVNAVASKLPTIKFVK